MRVVQQIVSAYLTPWVWGVIVSLVKFAFAFAFGNKKFPVVLLIFRAIKKPVYRCKSYDMITW
jgi:Na+(H+)/acetate symporter ActP